MMKNKPCRASKNRKTKLSEYYDNKLSYFIRYTDWCHFLYNVFTGI